MSTHLPPAIPSPTFARTLGLQPTQTFRGQAVGLPNVTSLASRQGDSIQLRFGAAATATPSSQSVSAAASQLLNQSHLVYTVDMTKPEELKQAIGQFPNLGNTRPLLAGLPNTELTRPVNGKAVVMAFTVPKKGDDTKKTVILLKPEEWESIITLENLKRLASLQGAGPSVNLGDGIGEVKINILMNAVANKVTIPSTAGEGAKPKADPTRVLILPHDQVKTLGNEQIVQTLYNTIWTERTPDAMVNLTEVQGSGNLPQLIKLVSLAFVSSQIPGELGQAGTDDQFVSALLKNTETIFGNAMVAEGLRPAVTLVVGLLQSGINLLGGQGVTQQATGTPQAAGIIGAIGELGKSLGIDVVSREALQLIGQQMASNGKIRMTLKRQEQWYAVDLTPRQFQAAIQDVIHEQLKKTVQSGNLLGGTTQLLSMINLPLVGQINPQQGSNLADEVFLQAAKLRLADEGNPENKSHIILKIENPTTSTDGQNGINLITSLQQLISGQPIQKPVDSAQGAPKTGELDALLGTDNAGGGGGGGGEAAAAPQELTLDDLLPQ